MSRLRRRIGSLACALVLGACPLSASEMPVQAGARAFDGFFKARQWAEAEADARGRLALAAGDAQAAADLGAVVLASRQRELRPEAITALEKALAASPEFARGHFILGQLYGEEAQTGGMGALSLAGKCKASFLRAHELAPLKFEYAYALNEYYLEAPFIAGGSAGRARRIAASFEAFDPDAAAMLRARIRVREKNHGEAITILRAVPRRGDVLYDATRRNLISAAGTALIEQGRAQEMLPVFEALTAEFPNNSGAHLGLGRARLDTGDTAGAITALSRSIEISRGAEGIYRLGIAYQAAGRGEEARVLWQELLDAGIGGRMADDVRSRLATVSG